MLMSILVWVPRGVARGVRMRRRAGMHTPPRRSASGGEPALGGVERVHAIGGDAVGATRVRMTADDAARDGVVRRGASRARRKANALGAARGAGGGRRCMCRGRTRRGATRCRRSERMQMLVCGTRRRRMRRAVVDAAGGTARAGTAARARDRAARDSIVRFGSRPGARCAARRGAHEFAEIELQCRRRHARRRMRRSRRGCPWRPRGIASVAEKRRTAQETAPKINTRRCCLQRRRSSTVRSHMQRWVAADVHAITSK